MEIFKGDIRYQYAFDAGAIVDINDLTATDRKDYECVSCGNVLRPVLPSERAKHFRHKSSDISCSKETYLHRLGKLTFKSVYEDCLCTQKPYWLQLQRKIECRACSDYCCEIGSEWISYDLVEYFTEIKEETRDGNFIPDLMLTNPKGEKVYVEIAVEHKASYDKQTSGIRLVEFDIKVEKDLDIIRECLLKTPHPKVRLLNFKEQNAIEKNDRSVECNKLVTCFVVNYYGRVQIEDLSYYNFKKKQQNSREFISKVSEFVTQQNYFVNIESALEAGHSVKDCYLCDSRHGSPGREDVALCIRAPEKNNPQNPVIQADTEVFSQYFRTIVKIIPATWLRCRIPKWP